jgi:hypothetical protein
VAFGLDCDPEPAKRRVEVGLANMSEHFRARTALIAPLVVSGLLVTGCVGAPTYGTDKTQTEQLTSDLSGMFSMKPKGPTTAEYKPRPELVKPTTRTTELPPPQENIVTASTDVWPESPEQKRARLRADATANRDNGDFQPEIINDISGQQTKSTSTSLGTSARSADSGQLAPGESKKKRQQVQQQQAEMNAVNPTVRKTLTEPPVEYRVPAETAATDDLGEPEYKKARRLKAEAKGTKSWKDLVPWL